MKEKRKGKQGEKKGKKKEKINKGRIMTKSDTRGEKRYISPQPLRYLLGGKISFWKGGGGEYHFGENKCPCLTVTHLSSVESGAAVETPNRVNKVIQHRHTKSRPK